MGALESVALVKPDLSGRGDPSDTVVRRVVEKYMAFTGDSTRQLEGYALDVDEVDARRKLELPGLRRINGPPCGDVEI